MLKKSFRIGFFPVALYCPNRLDDLFHAQARLYGAPQMKETGFETLTSEHRLRPDIFNHDFMVIHLASAIEEANQEAKLLNK